MIGVTETSWTGQTFSTYDRFKDSIELLSITSLDAAWVQYGIVSYDRFVNDTLIFSPAVTAATWS